MIENIAVLVILVILYSLGLAALYGWWWDRNMGKRLDKQERQLTRKRWREKNY